MQTNEQRTKIKTKKTTSFGEQDAALPTQKTTRSYSRIRNVSKLTSDRTPPTRNKTIRRSIITPPFIPARTHPFHDSRKKRASLKFEQHRAEISKIIDVQQTHSCWLLPFACTAVEKGQRSDAQTKLRTTPVD